MLVPVKKLQSAFFSIWHQITAIMGFSIFRHNQRANKLLILIKFLILALLWNLTSQDMLEQIQCHLVWIRFAGIFMKNTSKLLRNNLNFSIQLAFQSIKEIGEKKCYQETLDTAMSLQIKAFLQKEIGHENI